MKRRAMVLMLATALWTAAAAASQDSAYAAESFTDRIAVELVNVDVWVTDGQGRAVTGLEAADFAVLHDGAAVPISHFTEIRDRAEQPPAGEGRAIGSVAGAGALVPSYVVVYFDQSRLHPRNVPALIESLEQFLDSGEVEPERVLILRQQLGLSVVAPLLVEAAAAPGSDPARRGVPDGLALEAETEQALQAIRDSWEQAQDAVGSASGGLASTPGAGAGPRAVVGGVGSGSGPDACGMFPSQVQPILDSFVRSRGQRISATLSNLFDTATFLAGLPGVKTLLYLSDGLDLQPGAALASFAGSLCPAGTTELVSAGLTEELSGSFLELTRHANSNRVTIHALQASGLRSPGASSAAEGRRGRRESFRSRSTFEASQRTGERSGLSLIASETGGRAVFNQNQLGPDLASIGQDLRSYYSLAYRPPTAEDGRREHRIEVKLEDGSLDARYRRGYVEKDGGQWLTERLEGALNLGITDNPLGIRLGAGDSRQGGEGAYELPLHVMVPVEGLVFLPAQDGLIAEITVRAMIRGVTSGKVTLRDKTFRVKGAPDATGWADLTLGLDLDAGAHVTAVGVRDEGSGAASFVSTLLEVGSGG